MSIKIFTVFVCVAVGTAAGFLIMKTYRRNLTYVTDVCRLIGELKRNIAYRRDAVCGIMRGFVAESPQLKRNIAEYVDFVGGKADKPTIGRGFLSKATFAHVDEFFSSLGRSDGKGQIEELDMHAAAFEKLRAEAEVKSVKYGVTAVKLGFLLGLGVGVLTL